MGFKFYDNLIDYSFYDVNWDEDNPSIYDDLSLELSKFKNKDYNQLYDIIENVVIHNKNRQNEILNDDPFISKDFINFYKTNREDFVKVKHLKIDMDLEKVLKSKL